jgi:hypothetical protein
LAGIYDLPLLIANHEDEPYYQNFVSAAFGQNEALWRNVSPVHGDYANASGRGGLEIAVLGASEGDLLVEKSQWEAMQESLEKQGWKTVDADSDGGGGMSVNRKELLTLPLEGTHDEIWKLGGGVRKSIELVISRLFPLAS